MKQSFPKDFFQTLIFIAIFLWKTDKFVNKNKNGNISYVFFIGV